jgi:hypothetical protein
LEVTDSGKHSSLLGNKNNDGSENQQEKGREKNLFEHQIVNGAKKRMASSRI